MRIGIDARFYGGEQSKGLGRYTQKLIEYLLEIENDENEYIIFLQEDAYHAWNYDHPRFFPVLAPYRWYTLAEQIFMPLLLFRARLDLVHFPHFNVPLLYRRPFVVTIHDLIIAHFPTSRATTLGPLLYRLKHWAGQIVMKHAAKGSKKIITVSEFSKKDIVHYYDLPEEKVVVTYEAADSHADFLYDPKRAKEIEKRYGISKPYLLYVGNAYPHKNLDLLLDMMKEIKKKKMFPYKLVLVGREDYFYKKLAQSTWAKNLDDVVCYTGFVPDADLPYLYHDAYAYLFPSQYEGFGLPPLEAMGHGVPVISSRSSCLPEILEDAALYFDSEDVSGIINALSAITQDTTKREQMIQKGFEQVRRYSWEWMAQQTHRVYASITNTKK